MRISDWSSDMCTSDLFAANKRLISEIDELEHKARRQDVLVDEHVLFGFYDACIPQDIFNGISFEKWRQDDEKEKDRKSVEKGKSVSVRVALGVGRIINTKNISKLYKEHI